MARTVSVGRQDFARIRTARCFYVDKTAFIRDWWEAEDDVTLFCRPRRFGKTLTLSTVECFLSTRFADRGEELFGGLAVWENEHMRELQGSVPVLMVSFASCKRATLDESKGAIKRVLRRVVREHDYLLTSPSICADDLQFLASVSDHMDDDVAADCLGQLCHMLHAHWGVCPVVLLDEYDTPLQEAWVRGFWEGMSDFVRGLFNSTFKTNPDLGRGLITGITRVASESIFSDLNNPSVITTSTPAYQTAMGFTRAEVAAALKEFGMADRMGEVKRWYDGYSFGGVDGMYNPWSVTSFLARRQIDLYWAYSSSNALVRQGTPDLKADFEELLSGRSVTKHVDERVDFRRLGSTPDALWSLLLASGYVRAEAAEGLGMFSLTLTNLEVRECMDRLVKGWFDDPDESYSEFIRALLAGDAQAMGTYLSDLAAAVMSSFDSGVRPSRSLPERFWHGLVLGLLVELRGRYAVESNRESGFGRSDVMLVPLDGTNGHDPAIILEFKVADKSGGEKTLADTVASALAQVDERRYAQSLASRGIAPERIHAYGVAFCGKEVLVGT
ncbi:MAG: AAA family ATPase [Coriobacteriales bacterium]|nr:AAA family ATPase [Coriobacteriales bacterium]